MFHGGSSLCICTVTPSTIFVVVEGVNCMQVGNGVLKQGFHTI